MLIVTRANAKQLFFSKQLNVCSYLGYVSLRYPLIYNLEVSFNFHFAFLILNVIKMFTVQ